VVQTPAEGLLVSMNGQQHWLLLLACLRSDRPFVERVSTKVQLFSKRHTERAFPGGIRLEVEAVRRPLQCSGKRELEDEDSLRCHGR
jgi:hypothetical protein